MEIMTEMEASQLNGLYLAFIGDVVWEYNIRAVLLPQIVRNAERAGELHSMAVKYECANFQNQMYNAVEPFFTETEKDIVRRTRNAHNNNIPKSTTMSNYKRASALEALIGFWHLTGNVKKIDALVNIAKNKAQ
jgi:ribonuclease-3 family protein